MPSSYSVSLRFELQFTGENLNVWGDKLNTALSDVDSAIAGLVTKALTTDYTLTTANGGVDEARMSALAFTGTGAFTVTIPSVSKAYDVSNACTGILTITTGSGLTAQIRSNETVRVRCDGTNVTRVQPFYYGNVRIQGVADPTSAQDAATKAYVDNTAWATGMGVLPGQGGNSGKFLTTDGVNPSWIAITPGSIGAIGSVAASLTGGLTVTGGITQSGSSKFAVTAVPALAIDFSANDVQTKSISANSAFTWTGLTAGKAQSISLWLTITSAAVPSWPALTKYGGGVDPGPTLGNGLHELRIATLDGVNATVSVVQKAVA